MIGIDLILFDLDGVIFSSKKIVSDAYDYAIAEFRKETGIKLKAPSKRAIIREMGKPSHQIICNFFPDLSEPQKDKISVLILESLCRLINRGKGEIYPGIPKIIDILSEHYKLRICSNGRLDYVESVLKTFDLEKYFHHSVYVGKYFSEKSELIRHYCKETAIRPSNTVLIGDRLTDIVAAKIAGVFSIGCEWGHSDNREELFGASFVADKPKRLLEILL